MPILAFLIITALLFYIFFKIMYVRSKLPMEKIWLTGKSSISLGLFVSLFGLNQFFIHDSAISRIIASVFLIYGLFVTYNGIQTCQRYHSFVIEEEQKNNIIDQ
ncbi:YtpI family protein [Ectobacillus polymachus]|uniref:YtpI family protein n=1 Tax=Ectobacillus polymachus TaxID=1508806 RepID=UPI003A8C79A0